VLAIDRFCRRSSLFYGSFAKETYNLKESTKGSCSSKSGGPTGMDDERPRTHSLRANTHPHSYTERTWKGVLRQRERPHGDHRGGGTHTLSHSTLTHSSESLSTDFAEYRLFSMALLQKRPIIFAKETYNFIEPTHTHSYTHITHTHTLIHTKDMGKGSCASKSR